MTNKIKVKKCINECPLYRYSIDGMECGHPYWKNKGAYSNMIITRGISIPSKCPLKHTKVTTIISI